MIGQRRGVAVAAPAGVPPAVLVQPTRGSSPSSLRTSASERSNTASQCVAATRRVEDRLAPALRARGQELHHEHVGVAVDDHPGQAVGLPVHEPQGVAVAHGRQRLAQRDRPPHSRLEQLRVGRRLRIEAPDARADLRRGTVGRHREHRALGRAHLHRVARLGLADHALDRAGEDPRMAALERLLATFLQQQRVHFFFARGCAAS